MALEFKLFVTIKFTFITCNFWKMPNVRGIFSWSFQRRHVQVTPYEYFIEVGPLMCVIREVPICFSTISVAQFVTFKLLAKHEYSKTDFFLVQRAHYSFEIPHFAPKHWLWGIIPLCVSVYIYIYIYIQNQERTKQCSNVDSRDSRLVQESTPFSSCYRFRFFRRQGLSPCFIFDFLIFILLAILIPNVSNQCWINVLFLE